MRHTLSKKVFYLLLLLSLTAGGAEAQNFFPVRWQIKSSEKPVEADSIDFNRSWQSQGLCELTGSAEFATRFNVTKKQQKLIAGKDLTLTLSMQCRVDSLLVNGHKVAEGVGNAGGKRLIDIPSWTIAAASLHRFCS